MLINEHLESELHHLHALAIQHSANRARPKKNLH